MSRCPWVPKPWPGCDAVLVDDPQGPEPHVLGVVVVGEGEGVVAVEPAVVGVAPLVALANLDHGKKDCNPARGRGSSLAGQRSVPAGSNGPCAGYGEPPVLRTLSATRYVTPLREGGSLPAIVEADDDGLYVVKFRGAGQGARALVAEVLAGELGRALGLPVPTLALVTLDADIGRTEPDGEMPGSAQGERGAQPRGRLPARERWGTIRPRPPCRPRSSPRTSSGSTRWCSTWTARPGTPTCSSGIAACTASTTGRASTCTTTGPGRPPAPRRPSRKSRITCCSRWRETSGPRVSGCDRRLSGSLFRRLADVLPDVWLPEDAHLGGARAQRHAYVEWLGRGWRTPSCSRRRPTVPAPCAFDYALVRVVPRVERGEFLNAGVIVWCLAQDYLAARVALDLSRLRALESDGGRRGDLRAPRRGAADLRRRSVGGPGRAAAAEGALPLAGGAAEHGHPDLPVHAGRAEVPEAALSRLFKTLVEWGT